MAAFYPRGWINSNGEMASNGCLLARGVDQPQWRDGKQWLPAGVGGGSPPNGEMASMAACLAGRLTSPWIQG